MNNGSFWHIDEIREAFGEGFEDVELQHVATGIRDLQENLANAVAMLNSAVEFRTSQHVEITRLENELEQMRQQRNDVLNELNEEKEQHDYDLKSIERFAVHYARKGLYKPEELLRLIQWYPPIHGVTVKYGEEATTPAAEIVPEGFVQFVRDCAANAGDTWNNALRGERARELLERMKP